MLSKSIFPVVVIAIAPPAVSASPRVLTASLNQVFPVPAAVWVIEAAVNAASAVTSLALYMVTAPKGVAPTIPSKSMSPVPAVNPRVSVCVFVPVKVLPKVIVPGPVPVLKTTLAPKVTGPSKVRSLTVVMPPPRVIVPEVSTVRYSSVIPAPVAGNETAPVPLLIVKPSTPAVVALMPAPPTLLKSTSLLVEVMVMSLPKVTAPVRPTTSTSVAVRFPLNVVVPDVVKVKVPSGSVPPIVPTVIVSSVALSVKLSSLEPTPSPSTVPKVILPPLVAIVIVPVLSNVIAPPVIDTLPVPPPAPSVEISLFRVVPLTLVTVRYSSAVAPTVDNSTKSPAVIVNDSVPAPVPVTAPLNKTLPLFEVNVISAPTIAVPVPIVASPAVVIFPLRAIAPLVETLKEAGAVAEPMTPRVIAPLSVWAVKLYAPSNVRVFMLTALAPVAATVTLSPRFISKAAPVLS